MLRYGTATRTIPQMSGTGRMGKRRWILEETSNLQEGIFQQGRQPVEEASLAKGLLVRTQHLDRYMGRKGYIVHL